MDTLEENSFLGVAYDSRFVLLEEQVAWEELEKLRLTSIAVQEARPPETGELDLSPYEGAALLVRGLKDNGWVYSAEVIDQAGPILTALVLHVVG